MDSQNTFLKNLSSIIKCIRREISDPFYSNVGSGLAYYFLLSIAPIMITLSYVAGVFFSESAVIVRAVNEYLPKEIADIIVTLVAPQESTSGLIAALFVFVSTLYLASRGIYALIKVADYASDNFEAAGKSRFSVTFIKRHLKAIILTFMMVLIIVISLLFMVFGKVALDLAADHIDLRNISEFLYSLYHILTYPLALAAIFLILLLFYSWMPTKRLPYKEVLPGAVFGSTGVVLASLGFAVYLRYFFNSNAIYGALSGVVLLLLWFFLISHVLVIGIMVNRAFKDVFQK
ncbi:MAG: YihY/virulence factor BrkB family protein [Firmicutes bacterium]|nr:YihY/virulence factor BrkB family protein [Bacillota bacterium]